MLHQILLTKNSLRCLRTSAGGCVPRDKLHEGISLSPTYLSTIARLLRAVVVYKLPSAHW